MSKATKNQKRIVAELNRIIHTCNLYAGHSRFINAHVNGTTGEICVENLQTGVVTPIASLAGEFRDGDGARVCVLALLD